MVVSDPSTNIVDQCDADIQPKRFQSHTHNQRPIQMINYSMSVACFATIDFRKCKVHKLATSTQWDVKDQYICQESARRRKAGTAKIENPTFDVWSTYNMYTVYILQGTNLPTMQIKIIKLFSLDHHHHETKWRRCLAWAWTLRTSRASKTASHGMASASSDARSIRARSQSSIASL